MTIIPLSEGAFTIDHTKAFVPFDTHKDNLQERSRGSLLVEIQPFLLITRKEVILLDAGLGFTEHGILQIYQNLSLYGFSPSDITMVLMSHLHRDHAGGIAVLDEYSGTFHLSFPQADHYVRQQELDYALNAGSPSYDSSRLSVLKNNERVHLIGAKGEINAHIQYEHSGGHSPFHQVFWIREDDEIVFFGGDEAPQLQQMKTRFIAKYDFDGKKAMELRQKWWESSKGEHWKFLFYHDIKIPMHQVL